MNHDPNVSGDAEFAWRLEPLMSAANDAILLLDDHWAIAAVNDRAVDLYGYSPAEMLGKHLRELQPDESRGGFSDFEAQLNRDGGAIIEAVHQRKNGARIDGESSVRVVNAEGRIWRLLIVRDITRRDRTLDELRESRDQLKVFAASLQNAREEERAIVARELHDELGQILSALKLGITMLEKSVVPFMDPAVEPEFHRQIADISKTIDGGVQDLRRIIRNLRPEILDTFGLVAALEWFGEEFQKRTGVTCTFRADRPTSPIPSEHSTALFRMYQEILTNVTKHANATVVETRLLISPEVITLTVKDNGRGFHPAKPSSPTSLGILGLRERATRLGGTMHVESQPGTGTTIHVTIPLTATPM